MALRKVTIKDVASKCGVSTATVSRAINNNGYVSKELKDMILILVQGDAAMWLYFDPINQKFCGYNFLYEF